MAARYDDISDSDEEEEECRVCRGPAEEGRSLFKPCKCSGSIGLTHQDCLTSWLEVTRGDGKCELCSTRFKFAPQYAEGTPERLSTQEVFFRILRRLGAKWLPRGLRALFAASLWLIVLPLSTSYIYHGWMHHPSAVAARWSWELAKRDTVGGAVIAIIIVVSFLSLMSFAEFLRFQWGGVQGRQGAAGERRGNGNRANNRDGARGGPIEGEIDDIIVHHEEDLLEPFIDHLLSSDEDSSEEDSLEDMSEVDEDSVNSINDENENNLPGADEVLNPMDGDEAGDAGPDDENLDHLPPVFEDEEDELEAFMRAQEEQEMEDQNDRPPDPIANPPERNDAPELIPNPNPPAGNQMNRRPRDDARFEPQFEPLQPAFADLDAQDDGGDVEINVALDELLGFRGPLLALFRNLLWLLVFNTAYLGVFAFAPSKFGGSLYAVLSKLLRLRPMRDVLPHSFLWVAEGWDSFIASMHELDKKSTETNLIYQPSQVAKMGLGYISFSVMIFALKAIVTMATRSRGPATTPRVPPENDRRPGHVQFRDDFREDLPLLNEMEQEEVENDGDNESIGKRFLGFLECAGAIAKVVILLFIKMLFLPLMLGIWLDLATLSLFEKTWSDRIEYAGTDLFGSIFLHWVSGITFMLLVTVSVLQLREVAHPDILARVIRPQEPQPDLLGNLLQETGATHTKRVLLSLGIYAALLAIHIWLPARLLLMHGMGQWLPLFQPKFWHILMPQIQVPAELFIFHLCMLGVLEKYKNNIGEMQHHWLLFMGNYLGMTNQILPREVGQFSLIGTLPVFAEDASPSQLEIPLNNFPEGASVEGRNEDIYPLLQYLLSESDVTKREETIRSSIDVMDKPFAPEHTSGITRRNGKKVLSLHSYIRLPSVSSTSRLVVKTSDDALLPTSIGPYRLKQGISQDKHRGAKVTNIEVWREVVGDPIPRPPEGWDDLGVGGAERHGRWAWGDEQFSEIENSVAVRTPFFEDPARTKLGKTYILLQLTSKMIFLLFVSWLAISVILCTAINLPLYTGHFALYLLRIPDDCVHDPLSFAVGILLLIPIVGSIVKLFAASNNGLKGVFFLLLDWVRSFKPHQTKEKAKTLSLFFALWLVVCPVLLGFLYCTFFVGIRDTNWYAHAQMLDWGTGTLLLNLWAIMSYFQMFTKKFWAEIVMGDGQGNANDENQDNGPAGARQDGNNPARNADRQGNNIQDDNAEELIRFTWQGKDGAIAHAVESLNAFILGWEWDKVDRRSLLQDCALPVLKHLAISCAVPTAALALSAPLLNSIGRNIGPTTIFRTFTVASILVDSVNSSKDSLQSWFQAAHKIARDDRYLIGEILLNYSPRSPTI